MQEVFWLLTSLFLLFQHFEVESFHYSNQKLINRPSRFLMKTNRNFASGPLDFLSGIFKSTSSLSKPERIEKIKNLTNSLILITKDTSNGIKIQPVAKSKVNTMVKELESLNEEKKITTSPLMNGNWKLIYTSNNGSSAGKLGFFIGRVDQDIELSSNKYINYVRLGGNIVQGALSATWDNLSPKVWKVKFIDVTISVLGIPITKKSLIGSEGIWRMTYIDDNIRILYAQGGKNAKIENVYILAKERF